MLWTVIGFLVLLFLSGFFSCAEIAMMSLSDMQVGRLVKKKQRHAHLLQRLKKNPHKLLETILIGNNLVNIGAAAVATAVSIELFGSFGVGVATGLTTFFVLLFGEIIPKSLGVNHRKRISLAISPILFGLQWVLTPVIYVIDKMASVFTKIFGEPERERITEEEVVDMISASEKDGHIKKREREMIQSVLNLDDTTVEEIMTPRLDVFCLEMHQPVGEVIDAILDTGFSRIPVYDKRMDNLKGVVIVKDLLRALKDGKEQAHLRELMQEVLFIPESKKLDKLLREFQKRKSPFAIVVDEHGLFIGIVSIEDVLEELVGEIYDETDPAEIMLKKLDADTFLLPGREAITDLNTEHHFGLPESDEYDTLAGLLLDRFGTVPKMGARLEVNSWRLSVEKVSHNRILLVRAEKIHQ